MKEHKEGFDFQKALAAVQAGQPITGKDGVLAPLLKQLTEAALEAELDSHLAEDLHVHRKNGKSSKRLKTSQGEIRVRTPRERAGTFDPQIVKKRQSSVSQEIEAKILSMYGLGMGYEQIADHVEELYGLSVSKGAITTITERILAEVTAWQQRPLQSHYPFVWLDAIHYKVREEGRYISKAVYTVLAVTIEGKKEVLGLYLCESEGAHFWLQVLSDLQHRGVEDILIASIDGLSGFAEAIATIYPQTVVQLCVVHQIRNSLRYVGSKHQKAFLRDLKEVYRASSKAAAETALDSLAECWSDRYGIVIDSWRRHWEHLSAYFVYPDAIRRIIYTTNMIESVHRQFRKLTKTKGGFPNDESLLKLLYMGIRNASVKWTRPIANWNQTLAQLAIYFPGRLDKAIDL